MNALRFCLFVGLLWLSASVVALSDSERNHSFHDLVARDTEEIPRHLRRWLETQVVPSSFEAITGDYRKIKEMVDRISRHIKKPCSVGSCDENRGKNAHPKVPAIDATRTLRHLENFYISANDVVTPLQEYIVGQGPLETTVLDLWKTVLETKTPTIVALSMPSDAGGRNPAYWAADRYPLSVSGWTLTAKGEAEVLDASQAQPEQRIVKRVFQAVHEPSGESRTITHIHYENWPDNSSPEPLLFHRFLHLMQALHPTASPPLFVHCSAGLGRSGTFVTCHSLCKEIHALHPSTMNIPSRVVELRMQRPYLVTTAIQYEAIYDAVKRCIEREATSKGGSKNNS